MRLEGKVALITGAGIGRACARTCLNEGAIVALVDINTVLPVDGGWTTQ